MPTKFEQLSFNITVPIQHKSIIRGKRGIPTAADVERRFAILNGNTVELHEGCCKLESVALPENWPTQLTEPIKHHIILAWRQNQVMTTDQVTSAITEMLRQPIRNQL